MKKVIMYIFFVQSIQGIAQQLLTQPSPGYIPNVNPISPTAMQFVKYGEIPVSEYSGVPNIEIPIYTIKEGDYELPIKMTYHAGGVRVIEEAGWVGLGWNLDVGSVVQVVNDRDDFGSSSRMVPDYYDEGTHAFELNAHTLDASPMAIPLTPSEGPKPSHAFVIYGDYYAPVNLAWVRSPQLFNASGYTNGDFVDSEPDVFKATFNGHSIQFVEQGYKNTSYSGAGTFEVLNKKGYQVVNSRNAQGQNAWVIYTPDGMMYQFNQVDEINLLSGCTTTNGIGSCDNQPNLSTRVWRLTMITTPTNRRITFSYEVSSSIQNFPSVSNAVESVTTGSISPIICSGPVGFDFVGMGLYASSPNQLNSTSTNYFSPHAQSYLNTISFSNGSILFKKSAGRTDLAGDQKLDSIIISNQSAIVRKYSFGYDYFRSTDNGNSWAYNKKTSTETTSRLKLLSFGQVGVPYYQFNYDTIQLPEKTSYATDYWGFYNGASNTSYVSNDHQSHFVYAKAGTLNQIIYPTGGATNFVYELNTFAPGYTNSISTGNGLRVKSISSSTIQGIVKQTTISMTKEY